MYFELKNDEVIKHAINAVYGSLGMVLRIEAPKRTNAQNDYYWNIVSIIAKHVGESKEAMHDKLKWTILGPDYTEIDGKPVARIRPSSSLSKEDFSPLIEGALQTASILGLTIPQPNYFGMQK